MKKTPLLLLSALTMLTGSISSSANPSADPELMKPVKSGEVKRANDVAFFDQTWTTSNQYMTDEED